jgi:hypothetical protein
MKRVVIESPYSADSPEGVERNVQYARACLLDSLTKGESPICSHLLHTQVFSDDNPDLRRQGIAAGHAWIGCAEILAVYEDLGVSEGMRLGIAMAERLGVAVEVRSLNARPSRRPDPPAEEPQPRPSSRPSRRG